MLPPNAPILFDKLDLAIFFRWRSSSGSSFLLQSKILFRFLRDFNFLVFVCFFVAQIPLHHRCHCCYCRDYSCIRQTHTAKFTYYSRTSCLYKRIYLKFHSLEEKEKRKKKDKLKGICDISSENSRIAISNVSTPK